MRDYDFSWKHVGDKFYYYNVRSGKISGVAFKYTNHDVWVLAWFSCLFLG